MKTEERKCSSVRKHVDHLFRYRGLGARLCEPQDRFKAAYYVIIPLEHIKDREVAEKLWIKADEKTGFHDYFIAPLNDIEIHCGITFYRKIIGHKDHRAIEIGCDYGHYWDEGRSQPDALELQMEAMRTIDDILEKIPMLQWCQGCGSLVEESDGMFFDGTLYCNACLEKRKPKED